MEDPWANAWGEPSNSVVPETSTITSSSSTWSAPSVSVIHGDHEDDISTPSWSAEPATQWSNPDIAETSLWSNEISTGWNPAPSTFDTISLTKDSLSEFETPFSTSGAKDDGDSSSSSHSSLAKDEDPPSSPLHFEPSSHEAPPSPILPPLSFPPPDDPDAFGTFEMAADADDAEGWSPSKPNVSLPSADAAWGTAWEEPVSAVAGRSDELDDAWETARHQKEKQDRHVPPELLSSILLQLEELSNDLWQNTESSSTSQLQSERIADFDSLGLSSTVQRLVPEDLTLPMNVPFSKTFTSKQLSEALILTRHSPLTRLSPMAMYMASKGSTSWEASIKARPTIVQDDVTPVGWKILETVREDRSAADEGKRKTVGLLSFFGRRATNSSTDASNTRRSASPVSISGVSSIKTGTSPRASVDSARSSVAQGAGRSTPSSPIVASSGSNTNQMSDLNLVAAAVTSSTSVALEGITHEPTPPPSAVSRFLGRFSSRPTKSSSRDSLSLSADDLEFLSDVPTTHHDSEKSADLDALSMMIKSPPLPTTLPPPLPPPPIKHPHPSRTSSQATKTETHQDPNEDFLSFFAAPNPEPTSSGNQLQSLTPVSAPQVNPVETNAFLPSAIPPPPIKSTPPTGNSSKSSQIIGNSEDQSWKPFDYPLTPIAKTVTSQRPLRAIMDSSGTSCTPPPSNKKPIYAFSLPPPPSFLQNLGVNSSTPVAGSSKSISALPLPLTFGPQPPPSAKPLQASSSIAEEDDDFSDFLSSPASSTQPAHLLFGDFTPAFANCANSSLPGHASNSALKDFDDFISPLPPQPPAKTSLLASRPSASKSNIPDATKVPTSQTNHSRKMSRKADHSRTLSLLETAAARGRWLAPPSPLPNALPGPPGAFNGKSSNVDLFDSNSAMQAQQAHAAATIASSYSSPALSSNKSVQNSQGWNFPPPSFNASLLHPAGLGPQLNSDGQFPQQQSSLRPSPMQNGSVPSTGAKLPGGLSAQDLSFFEGL